jgi:formamidopyrimidine-DNA glycosylase
VPELPEVETVKRGLEPHMAGARLTDVHIYRANLRFDFPEDFTKRLEGATVIRLERRAKYLLVYLDTDLIWVTHLGMTGRFQVDQSGLGQYHHNVSDAPKHRHMSFVAEGPKGVARIDFHDPRRFGFMYLLNPDELSQAPWWQGLGVEPLSDSLDVDYLLSGTSGRAQNLKGLLMDQRLIAGLGNIYVCEALYRAHLSPDMPGKALTRPAALRLVNEIKTVLSEAIEAGGSSISDFAGASGDLGYFQHRFKVYDREGEACLTLGCKGVIARTVHAGRSSFYCPSCQSGGVKRRPLARQG